jgi:serine/threonine protein kinase
MLDPGTRLGSYEVISPLGVGGMGEVVRAKDLKLGREVALKILPNQFAADPDRISRFRREAHLLASLNHPHIAAIYGLEEADGVRALVLELVEGETLADRIARGPIPVDEALGIAKQIAEALEAAHEQGIIHRDLKPANVKVNPDGRVKVLDFGLAKLAESPTAASRLSSLSMSPTITTPAMTQLGMILGTAAYMSPEQARGRPVDRHSDIWAFGCVLFEMLAGRRPFPDEETVSDTIAGVLKGEPEWSALPADVPPTIRALLERCLRKDVRRRLSHIAEARIAIDEPDVLSVSTLSAAPDGARYVWPAIALLACVAAVALAVWSLRSTPPSDSVRVRFNIAAPAGALLLDENGRYLDVGEAISPDGRVVAFLASHEGQRTIWIHRLDSSTSQPLVQTTDALRPVWSPDGQSLAFVAQGELKRVSIAGGPATTIARTTARDLAWGPQDVILLGGLGKPLLRVSANGGEPVPVTALGRGETTHDYPHFLPDGRHFTYMARRGQTSADWDVYVGSLDSMDRRALPGIHAAVRYSPSGHLLFERNRELTAVAFDPGRLEVSGEPFTVSEALGVGPRAAFAISRNGTLAYLTEPPIPEVQLAWFDRKGTQVAALGPTGRYERIRVSRDGTAVVFDREGDRAHDVFTLDRERGLTRVVSTVGADFAAVFSPRGDAIAFASSRVPATNVNVANLTGGQVYTKTLGAGGDGDVAYRTDSGKMPTDWSPDGRYVAFTTLNDVWALPMPPVSGAKAIQLTKTDFAESGAMFSPDGRWVAYQSNDSAAAQDVYVQPFPADGRQYRVSVNGGLAPRWSQDGRGLFYVAADHKLMAASITSVAGGLKVGTPVPLFEWRAFRRDPDYDVSGDRFLLKIPLREQEDVSIAVVVNWAATLPRSR